MLHFILINVNYLFESVLNNFNLSIKNDSFQFMSNVDSTNVYAHLMLQFGILVFLISLVALAAPAYFGLYGSFIITLVPLFFSWLYTGATFVNIYSSSSTIFINGFK